MICFVSDSKPQPRFFFVVNPGSKIVLRSPLEFFSIVANVDIKQTEIIHTCMLMFLSPIASTLFL